MAGVAPLGPAPKTDSRVGLQHHLPRQSRDGSARAKHEAVRTRNVPAYDRRLDAFVAIETRTLAQRRARAPGGRLVDRWHVTKGCIKAAVDVSQAPDCVGSTLECSAAPNRDLWPYTSPSWSRRMATVGQLRSEQRLGDQGLSTPMSAISSCRHRSRGRSCMRRGQGFRPSRPGTPGRT